MSRKQIGWSLGLFLFAAGGIRAQEPVAPQGQEPAQSGRRGAEGERGRGLFGKIGAIRADSIDITRADGSTVTVKLGDKTEYRKGREPAKLADFKVGDSQTIELNEDTSIRKGQESITLADLQPGDHVFARGAVQNEVFVPKMLVVVPPEQWKRMQEMGGFGQGGAKPATESPKPPQPQGPNW